MTVMKLKNIVVSIAAICAAITVLVGSAAAGRIAALRSRAVIENAFVRVSDSVDKAIESIGQIIERSLDLAGD